MERRSTSSRDDRGSSRDRDRDEPRGRDRDDRGGRDRDERPSRGRDEGSRRSSFQYETRSKEDIEKRAAGSSDFDHYLKDHIKVFKPHDGANSIRILPPTWAGKKSHYGIDVHVHFSIGPDNQNYLCLQQHKDEPCPVCDERAKAKKDGDEDYAKEIRPVGRTLVYLVDRDNEKEGVQAWAMPAGLDQAIVKVCIDRRTGDTLPIDHPEDGYDVEFEKTGTGIKTKYVGVAISRRSSSLGKAAWLDFAVENPLPDQLVFYTYDQISKEFGGGGESKSRDDGRSKDRDDDPRDRGRGGRDRDEEPSGRGPKKPTREEVLDLSGEELDKLVEEHKLDIRPQDFDNDEDLQAEIIKVLGLDEEPRGRGRGREDSADGRDEGRRLSSMRREREGR